MNGSAYDSSGGSSAPTTHPAPFLAPSGPSSLQNTQSSEISARLPSSLDCCLPFCPLRERGRSHCTALAAPQPEGCGTLLSEVKGRQCFQTVTCFTQRDSSTPKAFLIRESCIQVLHFVPVGVLELVAECVTHQASQVCKIPGGSWHEENWPCVVPHQQSDGISPLWLTHHPQCASRLLSPLEKLLHQRLKDQGFLFPEWQLAEPRPPHQLG